MAAPPSPEIEPPAVLIEPMIVLTMQADADAEGVDEGVAACPFAVKTHCEAAMMTTSTWGDHVG